jgi:methylase of polypeptide subunit release factors
LILEHGDGQHEQLAALCRAGGYTDVSHHRDLAGTPRVLRASR